MLTELEANVKAAELSRTSRYPVSVWFADKETGWDYGIMETGSAGRSVTPMSQLSASRQRDVFGFENSSASRALLPRVPRKVQLYWHGDGAAVASWLCGKE